MARCLLCVRLKPMIEVFRFNVTAYQQLRVIQSTSATQILILNLAGIQILVSISSNLINRGQSWPGADSWTTLQVFTSTTGVSVPHLVYPRW